MHRFINRYYPKPFLFKRKLTFLISFTAMLACIILFSSAERKTRHIIPMSQPLKERTIKENLMDKANPYTVNGTLALQSKAAPALAYSNNKLYMVLLGAGSNDLWYSSISVADSKEDPLALTRWAPNKPVANKASKETPAIANYNGKLHMVYTATSSNDLWYSSFDGNSWTTSIRILNVARGSHPALASFNGKLYLVYIGNSSKDLMYSSFNGSLWTHNIKIPNQSSKARPALASFNGKLHMVHLGNTSNDLWYSSFNGTAWSPNIQISNQSSKATPSLASFNNKLHMLHLGNTSNDIWHSSFDGSSWTANERIPNQTSKATPAIASIDNQASPFSRQLHMVHLGDTSNDVWYSSFKGSSWTNNVKL